MLSPVFQDLFVPETAGVSAVRPLSRRSPRRVTALHSTECVSTNCASTTGRNTTTTDRERLPEPVRLGVVLSELAARYGLTEEPGLPLGFVNVPPRTFEFAATGLLTAMV